MSNKRKLDDETSRGNAESKKSKKDQLAEELRQNHQLLCELLDSKAAELETYDALDYFKSIFPKMDHQLPTVVHLHQLYSLIKSKTQVDREIESLRAEQQIVLFKYESNKQSETLVCFWDEYRDYVRANNNNDNGSKQLIDLYLDKILLNESASGQLSVDKSTLVGRYRLDEAQISKLVHMGVLSIKDPKAFWHSIPGLGKFRRLIVDARSSLMNILRKQKYKEMNTTHFYDLFLIDKSKSFRNVNKIGASYVLCDLIGNDLISKVHSPLGLHVRLINSN